MGLHDGSDLWEWSGCILRSLLWPTARLWSALQELYTDHMVLDRSHGRTANFTLNPALPAQAVTLVVEQQIGVHFRCGDHSYTPPPATQSSASSPQLLQCVSQANLPWQGTSPLEELSLASPLDVGQCAVQHLASTLAKFIRRQHSYSPYNSTSLLQSLNFAPVMVLYIASDNALSAQQIFSVLKTTSLPSAHHYALLPVISPPGCHVALNRTFDCMTSTLLYWFALGLSNKGLIVQGHYDIGVNETRPVSSFSRTALWYSLAHHNGIIAENCSSNFKKEHFMSQRVNHGRIRQGNWVCSGGKLY